MLAIVPIDFAAIGYPEAKLPLFQSLFAGLLVLLWFGILADSGFHIMHYAPARLRLCLGLGAYVVFMVLRFGGIPHFPHFPNPWQNVRVITTFFVLPTFQFLLALLLSDPVPAEVPDP